MLSSSDDDFSRRIESHPFSPRIALPAKSVPLPFRYLRLQRREQQITIPPEQTHPQRSTSQRSMRLLPLFCLLFILLLSLVFPFQLASEQNGTSVAPSTSINISHTTQHPATVYLKPTITPAMVTKQGACNMPVLGLWGVCATQVPAGGVKGTGTLINPLPGSRITQLYGLPEFQHWCYCISPHTGLDLAAPPHTPVLAADSGQVLWSGWDWSGLGWAVKIDHGNYVATVYGHMERVIVQAGQNVQQGEVIGYEGSTGDSTGPHLHFMVVLNNTWQDPLPYISQF